MCVKMYRLVNVMVSRFPNVLFRRGDLVAIQDIRKGERIRAPQVKKKHRTKDERDEIDRLADMAYLHALN